MEITQALTHVTVPTNGISLHVVQAGPADGEIVILLHGFPEFWRGWIRQIPALTGAGYRVWIPDQRGYNLSDKPNGVGAYDIDMLARDVVGLIDASGQQKVALIGHDWGAAARNQRKMSRLGRIAVPTLMIWGAKDFALGREMAQPSIDMCDDGRLVCVEEAGHFVQHEEPTRVNDLILAFLRGDRY